MICILKAPVAFALSLAVIASPAFGQTPTGQTSAESAAPKLSFSGSIPFLYSNNILLSDHNRIGDAYIAPDLTLALSGAMLSSLEYRVYARTQVERYVDELSSNNSVARVGATLSSAANGYDFSLNYDNKHFFDGIFRQVSLVTNDVTGSVSRTFDYNNIATVLTPSASLSYRFADDSAARRALLTFTLDIEKKLSGAWSIVSAPQVFFYWYTDGVHEDRRDVIVLASLGLKYAFTTDLSLTIAVTYDVRASNFDDRNDHTHGVRALNVDGGDYHRFEIGPKLDFKF